MAGLGGRPGAPFGGNLLPRGAIGGTIGFGPEGQHVTINADGAHVSYDVLGGIVGGVHGTIHDVTGRGADIIVERKTK
jgi:hypothetical protein